MEINEATASRENANIGILLKNIPGSITLKPFNIVKDIYILFSSKTQPVSENAISPPCTFQVLPFILSSSP